MADSRSYPPRWAAPPPPASLIDFVAYKLNISMDSFYGRVLQLVPHADRQNLRRLRQSFPAIVETWEAWMEWDAGESVATEFVLPPTGVHFVQTGHVG
jgi:hypothetical protein